MKGEIGARQLITIILIIVFCVVVFTILKTVLGGILG